MNHKMSNDVTAGYIIVDVERLRKPMQLVADYLLKCMEVIETTEVITIPVRTKGQINKLL
jgi:hypothetical protein